MENFIFCEVLVFSKFLEQLTKAYLETCQTSMKELFYKNS